MKKVFFRVFSVFMVMSLFAACAFAFVACNTPDKNNTSDNEEDIEIIDQTDLFRFTPNDDGKSYTADLHIEQDEILPTRIFIPSHYNGIPVTAFVIMPHNYIHDDVLAKIEYLYIPETITGGHFIISEPCSYTYTVKSKNTTIAIYKGNTINGKKYMSTEDYINQMTNNNPKHYNSGDQGVYVGFILLPQAVA